MFIYKVYIYLPSINKQRRKTAPFNDTSVTSSSDHQTTGIYQGSADRCEGDRNSDIIRLLQKYQELQSPSQRSAEP